MKNLYRLALAGVSLFGAVSSHAALITAGRYQVVPLLSNMCSDVTGTSIQLIQKPCVAGATAQHFDISATTHGHYRLNSVSAGGSWTVHGSSTSDGAALTRATYSGSNSQQFYFMANDAGYVIRARHSGKCIEVRDWSVQDGGRLQQAVCTGASNQTFVLRVTSNPPRATETRDQTLPNVAERVYALRNVKSRKCVDQRNGSTTSGTQFLQLTCSGSTSQQLRAQYMGRGHYKLINVRSGLAAHVAAYSEADNAAIQQHEQHAGDNQLFSFVLSGTGYQIRSRSSGKCLAIQNGSLSDGALILQRTCVQEDSQRFTLQ